MFSFINIIIVIIIIIIILWSRSLVVASSPKNLNTGALSTRTPPSVFPPPSPPPQAHPARWVPSRPLRRAPAPAASPGCRLPPAVWFDLGPGGRRHGNARPGGKETSRRAGHPCLGGGTGVAGERELGGRRGARSKYHCFACVCVCVCVRALCAFPGGARASLSPRAFVFSMSVYQKIMS